MKKLLLCSLSLALLLLAVLTACRAQTGQEPQEPDPAAASDGADTSTPEPVKDAPPALPPEQPENTQPPEDTTPTETTPTEDTTPTETPKETKADPSTETAEPPQQPPQETDPAQPPQDTPPTEQPGDEGQQQNSTIPSADKTAEIFGEDMVKRLEEEANKEWDTEHVNGDLSNLSEEEAKALGDAEFRSWARLAGWSEERIERALNGESYLEP